MPNNQEIEARFLEINSEELKSKLRQLGAQDLGDDLLEEIIFYDKGLKWLDYKRKLVRIRKRKDEITLTYKHTELDTVDGTEEIEFKISDVERATTFLERIGLVAYRHQQKRRHTFKLDQVIIDIDTWPKVPTMVELEGPSEQALKEAAEQLGLDWSKAVFENPRAVIEKYYHIPVHSLKFYTFDKIE